MSTAVFKRLPVTASKMAVYEKVKVYRDSAGAAVKALEASYSNPKPLNRALEVSVQEVNFLEIESLKPQPVNLNLTNKSRDLDPYLTPIIRDLRKAFFP